MDIYKLKKSTRTVLYIEVDGQDVRYLKSGCAGDKKRVWYNLEGGEPRELKSLDLAKKQAILDFLHKHGDVAGIIL